MFNPVMLKLLTVLPLCNVPLGMQSSIFFFPVYVTEVTPASSESFSKDLELRGKS